MMTGVLSPHDLKFDVTQKLGSVTAGLEGQMVDVKAQSQQSREFWTSMSQETR